MAIPIRTPSRISLIALTLLSVMMRSPAAQQEPVRISVDLVVLHATVLDRGHQTVEGLTKANFTVYDDGVLQEIESVTREDVPVTVGLIVDNSSSMYPKRAEVIAAARAFARSSNIGDQMFLVNFNEHVTFGLPGNIPFTSVPAELDQALSTIATSGKTALYDAVGAAINRAAKGALRKCVLLVISDGADNASHIDEAKVVAMAKQSNAIIYAIGIYEPADPDRKPESLKLLATATGGVAFMPQSLNEVTSICQRIANDIRTQYTISYTPAQLRYDGKYRDLKLLATGPDGRRLNVRTRAGYIAQPRP